MQPAQVSICACKVCRRSPRGIRITHAHSSHSLRRWMSKSETELKIWKGLQLQEEFALDYFTY